MNAEVTGVAYVNAMNRDPVDGEYRRAFLSLALSIAKPRGRVFDFGSGPGLDARHYAAAGLTVGAFDVNDEMRSYFSQHCAAEIAAGSVRLNSPTYAEFLNGAPLVNGSDVDLIVANFAPLNLVADPAALFSRFASMVTREGRILASVLNPFFAAQLRRDWYRFPELLLRGHYSKRLHGVIPVTRWHPRRLARLAAPHFGLAAMHAPIAAGQFLFLDFRRTSTA